MSLKTHSADALPPALNGPFWGLFISTLLDLDLTIALDKMSGLPKPELHKDAKFVFLSDWVGTSYSCCLLLSFRGMREKAGEGGS